MERGLNLLASIVTISLFALSVLNFFGVTSLTLTLPNTTVNGVETGSLVVAVCLFICLAFFFGLAYSLVLTWASRWSGLSFIIVHPIAGLFSGFQSVMVAAFLLGADLGSVQTDSDLWLFSLAVGASLAFEGTIILHMISNDTRNQADVDRSRLRSVAIKAFLVNIFAFSAAWYLLMFEANPPLLNDLVSPFDPAGIANEQKGFISEIVFLSVPIIGFIGGLIGDALVSSDQR